MGWVTLTCRTKEDKYTASYYQLQLLKISREQRQRARYYQFEGTKIQNNQKYELSKIREEYDKKEDELRQHLSLVSDVMAVVEKQEANNAGTATYEISDEEKELLDMIDEDENLKGKSATQLKTYLSTKELELSDLQEEETEKINDKKMYYDDELEMNEEMASDEELMYQQEQNDVESQLEAINAEYDVVKDSASQEISKGVIKLA